VFLGFQMASKTIMDIAVILLKTISYLLTENFL